MRFRRLKIMFDLQKRQLPGGPKEVGKLAIREAYASGDSEAPRETSCKFLSAFPHPGDVA